MDECRGQQNRVVYRSEIKLQILGVSVLVLSECPLPSFPPYLREPTIEPFHRGKYYVEGG